MFLVVMGYKCFVALYWRMTGSKEEALDNLTEHLDGNFR